MHLVARAPVIWPDREALDRWWREQEDLADLETIEIRPDGRLALPDDSEEIEVRLVRGTHLRPGAAYAVESPALDGLSIDVAVGGAPERRSVEVGVTAHRGLVAIRRRRLLEASMEGLDGFDRIAVTGNHPHIKGSLIAQPDPDRPLDVEVRLRWLKVSATASVRPLRTTDGDELVVRFAVASRGLWTPAIAPVVAIVGRFARGEVGRMVEEYAETLSAIAEGREAPSRLRERRAKAVTTDVRWVRAILKKRLNQVHEETSARGWWASRGKAFRTAYAELPPVSWPDRDPEYPTWEQAATVLVREISSQSRSLRSEAITERVDWFGNDELHAHQIYLPLDPVEDPPGDVTGSAPGDVLRAEDLELAWLRSPRTTLKYFREKTKADIAFVEELDA